MSEYHLHRKTYFLFVGNIEPRKNLIRLLDAYCRLRIQGGCSPLSPSFLIGGQGWRNAEVHKKNRRAFLKTGSEVPRLCPGRKVLPALMSGAALFVYPSLYEGFGMPPLEAMACGTPLITSDVSSLPEVVGGAALLVNPYDVLEGLAEAMHRVMTNPELQEELRLKGLERAKLFSWEETARQTLKVYEEVHAGGPVTEIAPP